MNTPICDFVEHYIKSEPLRLHMPGHKGKNYLGFESYDITEIDGADSLFNPSGIIRESEENASLLFGMPTFYSAEGSSLCIRAMLYLCLFYAKENKKRPLILAGRNAHRAFLSAAVLLDFDVRWLYGNSEKSYLSCEIDSHTLDGILSSYREKPTALYITSPDYLGNTADIKEIAKICHNHGVLLVVDNAHGAYLKFLPESQHPIDLGADLCCDSAHKTLPVLTGGAYLHISPSTPPLFKNQAKNALALFASTSPSYLILQSLDNLNSLIDGEYKNNLAEFLAEVDKLKAYFSEKGIFCLKNEPLKLTLAPKSYGYTGTGFSEELKRQGLICEFSDPDFVVLMLAPELKKAGLQAIERAVDLVPRNAPILKKPPKIPVLKQALPLRQAAFSLSEEVPVRESCGRICANMNIACPPAVPIAICGEIITNDVIESFDYYGIKNCSVIKDNC